MVQMSAIPKNMLVEMVCVAEMVGLQKLTFLVFKYITLEAKPQIVRLHSNIQARVQSVTKQRN